MTIPLAAAPARPAARFRSRLVGKILPQLSVRLALSIAQ